MGEGGSCFVCIDVILRRWCPIEKRLRSAETNGLAKEGPCRIKVALSIERYGLIVELSDSLSCDVGWLASIADGRGASSVNC